MPINLPTSMTVPVNLRRAACRAGVALALAVPAALVPLAAAQAQDRAAWGAAVPVAGVNSAATEGCPIEAPDGKTVYVMSTRGPGGDQDIWAAPRAEDGTVGSPQQLPAPVNSDANDFCPTPLRGGSLLFVSTRGGTDAYGTAACGGGDIYLTRLSPATGEWAAPRNLGCAADGGPNGPGTEFGPSVVETAEGVQLYFSSGGALGTATQDVYLSRQRADGSFGGAEPVAELNTSADDAMPNVRKDGLEVVLTSSRSGGQGSFDIWSATRSSTSQPWSTPVNLGTAVNTAGSETRPSLSWKATRLYVGRSGEIYVASR
jgi:hypothetical protein